MYKPTKRQKGSSTTPGLGDLLYSPWANEPLNPILQGEVSFLSGLGCGESWLKEAGETQGFRDIGRGFHIFLGGKNEAGVCDPLEVGFFFFGGKRKHEHFLKGCGKVGGDFSLFTIMVQWKMTLNERKLVLEMYPFFTEP